MEPTDEGSSNVQLESVGVSNILSKHRKELEDFAETINIYESSSTPLVESKTEELSHLCFQEIEDVLRKQPKPPTFQLRAHIFSSIQKINEDLKQKIQAAQEEYKSSLKSLTCELKKAANNMVSAIINGETEVKTTATIYYEELAAIQSQMGTLEQRPKELVQKMLEDDTSKFLSDATHLEEALLGYRMEMTQHFQTTRCMSDQLFCDLHKQAEQSAKAKFNSDSSHLFEKFSIEIEKMHWMFAAMNELILRSEQNLVLQMTQKEPMIVNFYNNVMKTQKLKELQSAGRPVDNSNSDNAEENKNKSDWTEFLSKENQKIKLPEELEKLSRDNVILSTNKAFYDQRRSYIENMAECLKKAGGMMDPLQLEEHHDSYLTDACYGVILKLHRLSLGLVSKAQGHSAYVETLWKRIDTDWADIQQKNENLRLQETERELQRTKERDEAILKQKSLEEQRQQRLEKSTDSKERPSTSTSTASTATRSSSLHTISSNPQSQTPKILQPLALEFGLQFIRVGWMNPDTQKFEIIKNSLDEEATPSVVALTNDGKILVGSEATSTSRPQSDFKWKYSMRSIIFDYEKTHRKILYDSAGFNYVTKELFMGHMLSKVKDEVEKKLNGRWETVVLTVPLWYTSVHRQATRDAATIAGFKHIHLVNETSAAAMSCSDLSISSVDKRVILVGVCNGSYFDAAVYSVSGGTQKMESSCGDRHPPTLEKQQNKSRETSTRAEEVSEAKLNITEMVEEFKNDITSCVCINTNPENKSWSWFSVIAPILKRFGKETAAQGGHGLNVVEGAAVVAKLLVQHSKSTSTPRYQSMESIIRDKLTYDFEITYKGNNRTLVEYKSSLIKNGGPRTREITLEGSEASLKEGGVYHGALTYCIKPGDKAVLKGTVTNEGILKVELFTGTKQLRKSVAFTLSSRNLNLTEIRILAEYIQSLQGDSEDKKLFEQTKKQLQELLDDLRPKLDTLQGIQKAIVTKSVEEAAAVVDHSTSTTVTLQNKIEQLVTLRSKYSI